jgi:hypothetical protein
MEEMLYTPDTQVTPVRHVRGGLTPKSKKQTRRHGRVHRDDAMLSACSCGLNIAQGTKLDRMDEICMSRRANSAQQHESRDVDMAPAPCDDRMQDEVMC